MARDIKTYIGRFAPTPSGPLHLGSLSTALASWLFARQNRGQWFLRIDDLDTVRCRESYTARILRQLEDHGLCWNGRPYRQSERADLYHGALRQLKASGLIYPCACTRASSRREGLAGHDGPIYSGRCRNECFPAPGPVTYRLRTRAGRIFLDDRHLGRLEREIEEDIGDFIVRRADGVIGYYLASAIDEHDLGITEIVRGADLLLPSLRHQLTLEALELPPATYRHIPIILDTNGTKLSKQTQAPPVDENNATVNLLRILSLLGQHPPLALEQATPKIVLEWAIQHWNPDQIPRTSTISLDHGWQGSDRVSANTGAVQ